MCVTLSAHKNKLLPYHTTPQTLYLVAFLYRLILLLYNLSTHNIIEISQQIVETF